LSINDEAGLQTDWKPIRCIYLFERLDFDRNTCHIPRLIRRGNHAFDTLTYRTYSRPTEQSVERLAVCVRVRFPTIGE
jgi:hypothetical protein